MYISRVHIQNFRNFRECEVLLSSSTVIVGENKVGKSNLLLALRLILDPRLSDADRQLRIDDFWDGLPRPVKPEIEIRIAVEFSSFDDDPKLLAALGESLVKVTPSVARLTYVFRPKRDLKKSPNRESDYEFFLYGGNDEENILGPYFRRHISLKLLPALRDAENDLASWRRSPLAPLLDAAAENVEQQTLSNTAEAAHKALSVAAQLPEISDLGEKVQRALATMVGDRNAMDTTLGFIPKRSDKLLRSLRILIDNGTRTVDGASLGTANLLYLALMDLELQRQLNEGDLCYSCVAIEEPEAHLHPQLQRLTFRNYLEDRGGVGGESLDSRRSFILTTHSPHIVSVAPLASIVFLKATDDQGTTSASLANMNLHDRDVRDLERYLDVTRAEILFAKGVILVEGASESYIIPALAACESIGVDLERSGIVVCPVNGTYFEPYVRLLEHIGVPYAVITDLDPQPKGADPLAYSRVSGILNVLGKLTRIDSCQALSEAESDGIFVNSRTLEIELWDSGLAKSMAEAVKDISTNGAARERAHGFLADDADYDDDVLLKDIAEIGKGRFAQRFSAQISKDFVCPDYIRKAVQYVAANT